MVLLHKIGFLCLYKRIKSKSVLRAIPDKNQKILNGAGHSWSQIFMKLSEHVKVVTLSKYSTLFFSQHARLPWQPDTKILAFKSAKLQSEFAKNHCFFLFYTCKTVFISFVFNTNYEKDNLDQTFLHYHN